ncbi:SpoIIE family protein phosphatase [Actinomadura sp. WMMB 499]|uniref:SpoIIE family protein phosphatase n=1 Tax=Actinomadura sp. WMMB 499 TaxID=1219491 RepID=UPI00159E8741|nr:SpoIIE family protein phosphatase [Actinomadura sp. WMMB 499]
MSSQADDRTGAVNDNLVEAMNSGVLAIDADGRITAWNPRAQQLLGYTREEVLGRDVHGLLHRDGRGCVPLERDCRLRRALRTRVPGHGDGENLVHRDGRLLVCSWSSAPIYAGGPSPAETEVAVGVVLVFQDAAERFVIEDELRDRMAGMRRAISRLELVAEITTVLSSTLNEDEVLRRLVRLVVPALGDWAEVDLLISDGRVERVAATHRESTPEEDAALEGPLPPLPRTPRGSLARVLRGGMTVVTGGDASESHPDEPLDAAQRALFRVMGADSAISAPLAARGEVYGALTLGFSRPGHGYGTDDRLVIEDIARRVGLVVANARLFAAQRNTAEAMQRSLLPPLFQPGDLQFQARYLPATEASRLGGDWYDAFELSDGATGLAIGDVVGHDLQAAARMAQVRNMLRALAWDLTAPPSTVLERLDGAMDAVSEAELATAVFARVERAGESSWRLRWCNAGHLPPLLVTRDGGTQFLEEHGMLLGDPELAGARPDGVRALPPLSTLLLYTDGLVETRDSDLTDRLTGLRRHSAQLARFPLSDLCDRLIERMRPSREDDIALLALRIPG